MRVMDERPTKEMRRENLALAMLRRDIRTQTISDWTGLRSTRVDSIRHSHRDEFPEEKLKRPPGRPPATLRNLLRSQARRCEAAALGGLCKVLAVIPVQPVPDAHRYLPSVPRGEGVCGLYDAFRSLVPCAQISAEHLIWLSLALAQGESLDVTICEGCDGCSIVDPFDVKAWPCINCSDELWEKAIEEERRPKKPRRKRQGS